MIEWPTITSTSMSIFGKRNSFFWHAFLRSQKLMQFLSVHSVLLELCMLGDEWPLWNRHSKAFGFLPWYAPQALASSSLTPVSPILFLLSYWVCSWLTINQVLAPGHTSKSDTSLLALSGKLVLTSTSFLPWPIGLPFFACSSTVPTTTSVNFVSCKSIRLYCSHPDEGREHV